MIARTALGVVWGWAGWAKVQEPQAALQAVRAYRILPEVLVGPVGYGLPALELAISALLLLGLRCRLAGVLSSALLAAFLAGVIQAQARGLSIDCGCFGGGGEVESADTQYLKEVLRDLVLLWPSVWLAFQPAVHCALDNLLDRQHVTTASDQQP
ncbi:MauE/DoxX family redox-associated membrane protein [Streptomyces sp. Tue 6075]|uniref:MauE/DoxX family redox-associated membrane protein n=1 Tax=Streptomyces sp. Tue 6075 TaxID=1661694 RepID=UPI00094AFD5A|nr:MauE/DoxX family redox-associated membrane protein [Streptomyces sp. Tue 6075]